MITTENEPPPVLRSAFDEGGSTLNSQPDLVAPKHPSEGGTKPCQRKGKIARLPKAARDMINRMIDDGLPYHVIIDELGEAGEGLNTQNLTNWKQGGYQDYLKIQETIEKIKAQTEAATEILQGVEGIDTAKIMEACRQVAAVQFMEALMEQGDDAIRKAIADEPARYFTLLNSVCSLANSGLRYHKCRREIAGTGK